jgi:hypothetical protein
MVALLGSVVGKQMDTNVNKYYYHKDSAYNICLD